MDSIQIIILFLPSIFRRLGIHTVTFKNVVKTSAKLWTIINHDLRRSLTEITCVSINREADVTEFIGSCYGTLKFLRSHGELLSIENKIQIYQGSQYYRDMTRTKRSESGRERGSSCFHFRSIGRPSDRKRHRGSASRYRRKNEKFISEKFTRAKFIRAIKVAG